MLRIQIGDLPDKVHCGWIKLQLAGLAFAVV
jgi:hypothetical protein